MIFAWQKLTSSKPATIIDEIVQANPKVIEYRDTQGETYLYLGRLLAERGQTERARANLEKVITMERELVALNPTMFNGYASLAESATYLAGVERETGRFDLAAKYCEEALRITKGRDTRRRMLATTSAPSSSSSSRLGLRP